MSVQAKYYISTAAGVVKQAVAVYSEGVTWLYDRDDGPLQKAAGDASAVFDAALRKNGFTDDTNPGWTVPEVPPEKSAVS